MEKADSPKDVLWRAILTLPLAEPLVILPLFCLKEKPARSTGCQIAKALVNQFDDRKFYKIIKTGADFNAFGMWQRYYLIGQARCIKMWI